MAMEKIQNLIRRSIQTKQKLLKDRSILLKIEKAVQIITEAAQEGKKILVFGNGGSAADAQHFAAELVGKFKQDRTVISAISLVTDTSILSGISNDFGYDYVFSRQIEALGQRGDVAIALTTSDFENKKGGHSANIMYGLKIAKRKGLKRIILCSHQTKKLLSFADIAIQVPTYNTQNIQEAHTMLIHVICELIKNDTSNK